MKRRHLIPTLPLLLSLLVPAAPASQAAPSAPQAFAWRVMGGTRTPSARDHQTTVWTGTEMLIWGGGGGGGGDGPQALATGWRYNPTTDTWAQLPDLGAPSPRTAHAGVWT